MSSGLDNNRFRKLLRAYPLKAITILREHYGARLLGFSTRLTSDPIASEDIVHDTFLHVWEHHRKLAGQHQQSIEHYLVRVVRNKSIACYKKSRHLVFDDSFLHGQTEDPEQTFIQHQLMRVVRDVIDTFPGREQQCMSLWLEGLNTDQIATKLKVTVKAVEARLTSARKRLRKWAERET